MAIAFARGQLPACYLPLGVGSPPRGVSQIVQGMQMPLALARVEAAHTDDDEAGPDHLRATRRVGGGLRWSPDFGQAVKPGLPVRRTVAMARFGRPEIFNTDRQPVHLAAGHRLAAADRGGHRDGQSRAVDGQGVHRMAVAQPEGCLRLPARIRARLGAAGRAV